MVVEGVRLDPDLDTPVLVLREQDGDRVLPIWIGFPEAGSIVRALESIPASRPNTHDLILNLLESLEGEVERVVVTEVRNTTYIAVIEIAADGHTLYVDARPSDAIAIAVRTGAPVFVREDVLQDAQSERLQIDAPPDSHDVPAPDESGTALQL